MDVQSVSVPQSTERRAQRTHLQISLCISLLSSGAAVATVSEFVFGPGTSTLVLFGRVRVVLPGHS